VKITLKELSHGRSQRLLHYLPQWWHISQWGWHIALFIQCFSCLHCTISMIIDKLRGYLGLSVINSGYTEMEIKF